MIRVGYGKNNILVATDYVEAEALNDYIANKVNSLIL